LAFACSNPEKEAPKEAEAEKSTVVLPYTPSYITEVSQDVSDADLLTVLNSYKAWETGDMTMLRATLADSISYTRWTGATSNGPADDVIAKWSASRDSLSDVTIDFAVWTKNHSVDRNEDYITVWYREIDTYKNGKIDSADWHDVNLVKNGKIVWYSQYKRGFKAN
jgi:ketosteroid isomerase-like protein